MLILAVQQALADAGARVTELPHDGTLDALWRVDTGDISVTFVVETKNRAPLASQVADLAAGFAARGARDNPLLVVPFVSETLAAALAVAKLSWADHHGNFDLRAPGMRLRQRSMEKPPASTARTLPQGSGALAIIRSLINFHPNETEQFGASSLAAQAKVSQPRSSQVLRRLQDLGLVTKSTRTRWEPDREALLDRFLAEYRGPGGTENYFYSLDEPMDAAIALVASQASVSREEPGIVVSADVGPDLVEPWRRPTLLVIYARTAIDAKASRLVRATGRNDANVIIREPADQSIWPNHQLTALARSTNLPLADPTQMVWDLQRLGGDDRLEAAEKLRQWILTNR